MCLFDTRSRGARRVELVFIASEGQCGLTDLQLASRFELRNALMAELGDCEVVLSSLRDCGVATGHEDDGGNLKGPGGAALQWSYPRIQLDGETSVSPGPQVLHVALLATYY